MKGPNTATLHPGEDIARAPLIKEGGGTEVKLVQERTATPLKMVFIARISSSSHETGARASHRLSEALSARGHHLLILEAKSDKKLDPLVPGQTLLYDSLKQLKDRFAAAIRNADFVMVSSNVSESAAIGDWVTQIAQGTTAFYDLNTPATLAELDRGGAQHLTRSLIRRYQLYFSYTGGPLLELLKKYYGAQSVRPLYGSVDTSVYYPERARLKWDLGYAGNFNDDRLPGLDELFARTGPPLARGPFRGRWTRIHAKPRLAQQRETYRQPRGRQRARLLQRPKVCIECDRCRHD